MRTLARHLTHRLRALPRDENGQSALFAVLTLMLLMIVIAYTYNVGTTVSQRVRLQNAADAAAYSGAVVEANALSSIAWLNNCETYLHAKLEQHMLDVVMYSTASSIANWGKYTRDHFGGSKDTDTKKPKKHKDREKYEWHPFITYFVPIPFVVHNGKLETNVFGQLTALDGAPANGYPPADEFKTVFDKLTFKKKLPATTLQDLADAMKDNLSGLDFGEDNPLDAILEGATEAMKDFGSDLPGIILDTIVDTVKTEISNLMKNLVSYLVKGKTPTISISKIMKTLVKKLVENMKAALLDAIKEFLGNVFDSLTSSVKDYLLGLIDKLLEFEKQQYSTFEEVFDEDLYSRLRSKYGPSVSVANAEDVVNVTKDNVLKDATTWIANPDTQKRPGELWIRQLSLAASAIAKALPALVRSEVLYSVSYNAPPDALVAIYPAPALPGTGASSDPYDNAAPAGTRVFNGKPALKPDDASAPSAFFRYDAYPTGDDFVETNRFLAESRRQAHAQGMKYVRKKKPEDDEVAEEERVQGPVDSIILKPEISHWWNERDGVVEEEGEPFLGILRCWNRKDRLVEWAEPPDDDSEWEFCPIGYAPGKTPGSPMAKPLDEENAADGHWHVKHGHSHGEGCVRSWGGLCLGIYPLPLLPLYGRSWLCFYKCIILEIAWQISPVQRHHMQFLNHQANYHWDGLVEKEDNKHIYCAVAVSNRTTTKVETGSGEPAEVKTQYPDLVPGLRFPKICWLCKFVMKPFLPPPWPWPIPLPDCACTRCPKGFITVPEPPGTPPPGHATAGDPWGVIFEYLPLPSFPPLSIPTDNWPEEDGHQSVIWSFGPFAQPFPGHFWTKADWEGFFSGDIYWYSREHYLTDFSNTTDVLTGYGIPDALIEMLPEPVVQAIYFGLEIRGRIVNWMSRKGHHGFMVCPLCMGNCPVCKKSLSLDWPHAKHWGLDRDGDEQSDVGMTYKHVLGTGGASSNGHDKVNSVGAYQGYDLGTDINLVDGSRDLSCDRFVRKTWAPRTDTGTPKPELAPAVVLTKNFFKHGVTVALWAPHRTFFFRDFFGRTTGQVAVATARAGFVEPKDDPDYELPKGWQRQIITGIGEPAADGKDPWSLDRVEKEFLAFRSNKNVPSNLYYPDWGAKLVGTRYALLPASADNRKKFWRGLGAAYCYTPAGARTGVPFSEKVTGGRDDWNDFVEDYVDWMN